VANHCRSSTGRGYPAQSKGATVALRQPEQVLAAYPYVFHMLKDPRTGLAKKSRCRFRLLIFSEVNSNSDQENLRRNDYPGSGFEES